MAGFAGGFTGSALNTWANGGSFIDGIVNGFRAGVQGALVGAAVGGITGGLRAKKMGLDFFKGDKIVDEIKFNELFGTADVACTDCNFSQGERLSEFRADLSGSDDGAQLIKAYRKAKVYNIQGKKVTLDDLFDYDKFDKIKLNGWKSTPMGQAYIKSFKYKASIFESVVPKSQYKNSFITNVSKWGKSEIRMFDGTVWGKWLSRLNFTTYREQSFNQILDFINLRTVKF